MLLTLSPYLDLQTLLQKQPSIRQSQVNRKFLTSSDSVEFSTYKPIRHSAVHFGYSGFPDEPLKKLDLTQIRDPLRPWVRSSSAYPFSNPVVVYETYRAKHRESPPIEIMSRVLPGFEPEALAKGIAECHREAWMSNPPLDAPKLWVEKRPAVFVGQDRVNVYIDELKDPKKFWMIATCKGATGADYLSDPNIVPVIGFIQAQRESKDVVVMELPFCYVLADRQRQGLGSLMMSKLLRYCIDDQNIQELKAMVQLKSTELNDKALNFYRWVGFDFAKDSKGREKPVEIYRLGNDESGYYDSKQKWITIPRDKFEAALAECEQKTKDSFDLIKAA